MTGYGLGLNSSAAINTDYAAKIAQEEEKIKNWAEVTFKHGSTARHQIDHIIRQWEKDLPYLLSSKKETASSEATLVIPHGGRSPKSIHGDRRMFTISRGNRLEAYSVTSYGKKVEHNSRYKTMLRTLGQEKNENKLFDNKKRTGKKMHSFANETMRLKDYMRFVRTNQERTSKPLKEKILHDMKTFHLSSHDGASFKALKEKFAEIIPSIHRLDRYRRHEAISAFVKQMDVNALDVLVRGRSFDLRYYNWLSSGASEQVRDYRRGAAVTHPSMLYQFNDGAESAKITGKIDKGASVNVALSSVFSDTEGVPLRKKTFAPLHGIRSKDISEKAIENMSKLAPLLSVIRKEWVPKSPQQWDDLMMAQREIGRFCNVVAKDQQDVILETGGDYAGFVQKISVAGGVAHSGDMIERIHEVVVLPEIIQRASKLGIELEQVSEHKDKFDYLASKTLSHYSMLAAVQANKHWHDRISTFQTRLRSAGMTGDFSWPVLIDRETTKHGVEIVPLVTKAELEQEGEEMDHCIGGYGSKCAEGIDMSDASYYCHAFSLRYDDGKEIHRSSLTINEKTNYRDGKVNFSISQNLKQWNKSPNQMLANCANDLVKALNEGDYKIDWDGIYDCRQKVKLGQAKQRLVEKIGFDPMDSEKHQDAFEVFQMHFKKSDKHISLDKWLKKTGLDTSINEAIKHVFAQHLDDVDHDNRPVKPLELAI